MGASIKTILFSLFVLSTTNLSAAINSKAMTAEANSESTKTAQMVNLNLKIKAKNLTVKSELMMPFYQTAEFERKFGDKNVLIEMSPKRGKNADEIALEMKFYKAEGSKAFYKKEIIAKLNEESYISFKGMSVKVTPVL